MQEKKNENYWNIGHGVYALRHHTSPHTRIVYTHLNELHNLLGDKSHL